MTCDTALDRLLDAAPSELRGEADTGLSRHLAGCGRCAAVAVALLEDLDAVDAAFVTFARRGPVGLPAGADPADAAAAAALAAARGHAGDGAHPGEMPDRGARGDRGRPGWRTWTRGAWVPLAAAAVLALVLLLPEQRPGPSDVAGSGAGRPEPAISVTPPADRAAAIMQTSNPNITIVWLYEREES